MIEAILISWAALGLSLPIAKLIGIIDRAHTRKQQGKKTNVKDVVNDVRHMQAAESQAYEQVAKALCGGEHAPDFAVKTTKLAMKGLTSYATPNVPDLLDGSSVEKPNNVI